MTDGIETLSDRLTGEVDNGRTSLVQFGNYSGPAGIREREGFVEVAYFGTAPRKFPADGIVEGRVATATGSRDSRIPDMVVLVVPNP